MKLTFRTLMIGVAIIGLGFGASFGAGIAYGRGTPKAAASAPTQQQLNSQLGVSGAGSTGGTAVAGGGAQRGAGGAGGAAQALGRSATGRITAVDGRTITIETAAGAQKVNLAANATLERVTAASAADFKVGDTILASGVRNADGSFDASSVSQVPSSLQGALGAGGAQPAATPTR